MSKFRVSVHGKNCKIGIARRKYLFFYEYGWEAAGFYTTRFIETETANEAIDQVFELLRGELHKDGRLTDESILDLEEICEDEEGFDQYAPGGGYTFYTP